MPRGISYGNCGEQLAGCCYSLFQKIGDFRFHFEPLELEGDLLGS
ncbi:MAG: hypothetical protein ACI8XO_000610 [Verrucomicrobiales bacterium]|jgi:hypothetical protein